MECYPEDSDSEVFIERNCSYSSQESVGSAGNDCNSGKPVRKTSIYEQKQIQPPCVSRGDIIASRTENLFKNYKRDISYHEAKPMVNINEEIEMEKAKSKNEQESTSKIDVARQEKEQELLEMRKHYQQRILDEERDKGKARVNKTGESDHTTTR